MAGRPVRRQPALSLLFDWVSPSGFIFMVSGAVLGVSSLSSTFASPSLTPVFLSSSSSVRALLRRAAGPVAAIQAGDIRGGVGRVGGGAADENEKGIAILEW